MAKIWVWTPYNLVKDWSCMTILRLFWQFMLCESLYRITLTILIEMAHACTFWSLDYYYGFSKGFYIDFEHAIAILDMYTYVSLFRQGPSVDWNFSCCVVTGEDLLSIGADQPFRFPATFTFVVRAFSGIANILSLEIVAFLLLKTDFLVVRCCFFFLLFLVLRLCFFGLQCWMVSAKD